MIKEIWGKLYNQYKDANTDRNQVHGQTGSGYHPDLDVLTLEALAFLNNYIENRPVHSTLLPNNTTLTSEAPKDGGRSQELHYERSIHQRSTTSQRVWVSPARQQRKLQPYLLQLPPKVPTFDIFAQKKHAQGNALYSQLADIGNNINLLGGAMLRQKEKNVLVDNDMSSYRSLLLAEIKKINKEDLFEFYTEVAKEFKHNK